MGTTYPHAEFGCSKFTYLGRNQLFLTLLGQIFPRAVRRVSLFGSGPLEPFEVAALACFQKATVIALDIDPFICRIIERGTLLGEVRLDALSGVCRAVNESNTVLASVREIGARMVHAHYRGVDVSVAPDDTTPVLEISADVRRRIQWECVDLRARIPVAALMADILFEGCMLINWLKAEHGEMYVRTFLRSLAESMTRHAVFASTASYGHVHTTPRGGTNILGEVVQAGLTPIAGVLTRWSVRSDRDDITSQVGIVCVRDDVAGSVSTMDHWRALVVRACGRMGLSWETYTAGLDELQRIMTERVVVHFQRMQHDQYVALCVSMRDMCEHRRCGSAAYDLQGG